MDKTLGDFKEYLNSILLEHNTQLSGGECVEGLEEKVKKLTNFTDDYNNRAIKRAIELLADPTTTVDKKALKDELAIAIRECSNKFLVENFKVK